ncbi:MAG: hypothetical protein KF780_14070 [Sphingomonas sp.]|nr:hypothetical protein [Sphingomonas sp.]
MQRVRIGLTGLAFVFLAVLLAAVFTREPAGEEPITPKLIEQQENGAGRGAAAVPQPPKRAEPLAELGVAPGNAESNNVASAAEPTPEPARR